MNPFAISFGTVFAAAMLIAMLMLNFSYTHAPATDTGSTDCEVRK